MLHSTPNSSPAVSPDVCPRGVFPADPLEPPAPPHDARAVKIKNSSGRIIAYGWTVAEHSHDLANASWDWLDQHDGPTMRLMR